MRKITFTNVRGESIVLDDGRFFVTKITGLGEAEIDTQTQRAPYIDGATYIDSVLGVRPIAIEGAFTGQDRKELAEQRMYMQRVFNPKRGVGNLQYEYDGGIKEIGSVAEGPVAFPDRERNPYQRFLINLLCPNPYWTDPQMVTKPLTAFIEAFTFPFEFPVMFGSEGDHVTIDNKGDVEAPVLIQIRGPVTNPRIENATTGEFIIVNRAFSEGEMLEIDTDPQHKRVEAIQNDGSRTNVFNWLDLDSTFWRLVPGENEIKYAAEAGTSEGTVTVSYQNHYVGI